MTVGLLPNMGLADEPGMCYWDTEAIGSVQDACRGDGVLWGGAVTDSTGLTCSVAAGAIVVAGKIVPFAAATATLTTGTALGVGFARRDSIVVDKTTGAVSVASGVGKAYDPNDAAVDGPDMAVTTNKVLLATHFMKAGEAASQGARLHDCRTIIDSNGLINVTCPTIGMKAGTGHGAANTTAMETLTGGSYWMPKGRYMLDSQADLVLTSSLSFTGNDPKTTGFEVETAAGFGTTTSNGNLINITTNGANTAPVDISFRNIGFYCWMLPNTHTTNGTVAYSSAGALTSWPLKNMGTAANSDAVNISDVWCNKITFDGCIVCMDEENRVTSGRYDHHWAKTPGGSDATGSGGDSGLSIDLEETQFIEIMGCQFYATRDSAVYVAQVPSGARDKWLYPAKVDVHDNFFAGCGNGVHVKGDLTGGLVHDNTFVNCANAFAASGGNADVSELCRFHHNTVDGYSEAVRLQGRVAQVDNNTIFNAGHFAVNGASMSDLDTAGSIDDEFDLPYVFMCETGGGNDFATGNVICDNDVWPEAVIGTFGRFAPSVAWGGEAATVFKFAADANDNQAHNNRIHGTTWKALAKDTGVADRNIISWSDSKMIDDHSKMVWTSKEATSFARGPITDVVLSADVSCVSDVTSSTVTEFDTPIVIGGQYRVIGDLIYSAIATSDIRIGFEAPGGSNCTGRWSCRGPSSSVTNGTGNTVWTTNTIFDAIASNSIVLGGAGTGTPIAAHLVGVIQVVAAAGTLNLVIRQVTIDAANASVIEDGSTYRVERIA